MLFDPRKMPVHGFNTQPPEGGCPKKQQEIKFLMVSTHSRLKAAVADLNRYREEKKVSTHSRLKAAVHGL